MCRCTQPMQSVGPGASITGPADELGRPEARPTGRLDALSNKLSDVPQMWVIRRQTDPVAEAIPGVHGIDTDNLLPQVMSEDACDATFRVLPHGPIGIGRIFCGI